MSVVLLRSGLAGCLLDFCESCFSRFLQFLLVCRPRLACHVLGKRFKTRCRVCVECCLGVPRAPGTSEAVFCVVQVDGYAVCLFSFVNSFVEAVFSIFSTFACLQASVDVV